MVRHVQEWMALQCCMVKGRDSPLLGGVEEGGDYHLVAAQESYPSSCQHTSVGYEIRGLHPVLSSRQPGIAEHFTVPECQSLLGSVRRGPASSCAEDTPSVLLVVSPNLLKTCAGCYVLEASAVANGQPLWKHNRGAFWLFSTPTGRWAIAGEDVKDGGFVKCSGWIYQECCHKGLTPNRSSSRWMLFDREEGAFTSDETFMLTAPTGRTRRGAPSCKHLIVAEFTEAAGILQTQACQWQTTLTGQLDPALLPLESIVRRAVLKVKCPQESQQTRAPVVRVGACRNSNS